MIRLLLILCAFAEGFLLWFLASLVRDGRRSAPDARKADRTRREQVSRSEPLLWPQTWSPGLREPLDEDRINLALRIKF